MFKCITSWFKSCRLCIHQWEFKTIGKEIHPVYGETNVVKAICKLCGEEIYVKAIGCRCDTPPTDMIPIDDKEK